MSGAARGGAEGPAPPASPATSGLRGTLLATGQVLLGLPRKGAAVVVLLWLGLIYWLSSWPAGGVPSFGASGLLTNLGHAFLFGLLGLWCALCLPRPPHQARAGARGTRPWPPLGPRVRVLLVLLVALLGLLDESHQHLADRGRDFSLLDVLTDVTGAWCVLAIAAYLRRHDSSEAGLVARLVGAVGACLLAAALATWGPELWPDLGWL